MTDQTENPLSRRRFLPHSQSFAYFKKLRDNLPVIQEKKPWIKGFAFFGSRTVGKEKEKSDLDLYVFYDGTQYKNEATEGKIVSKNGRLIIQQLPVASTRLPHDNTLTMLEHILDYRVPIMRTKDGHDERIIVIDISKESTDRDLKQFIDDVNTGKQCADQLPIRFLLGIGDDLYANRLYILDMLQKIDKGQKYLTALMDGLQLFERITKKDSESSVLYELFPKTYEEARSYFLTKFTPL